MRVFRVQGVTITKQNTETPPYVNTKWTDSEDAAKADFQSIGKEKFLEQIENPQKMLNFIYGFELRLISANVDSSTFAEMSSSENIENADAVIEHNYTEIDSKLEKP